MPSSTFRVGVANVQVSVDDAASLPSLSTLSFTASAEAPTSVLRNDVKRGLDTTTTYQVMLGLVGRDDTSTGYTVGYCSPGSGILAPISGQGIRITVPVGSWPPGYQKAACVAIFLKIGGADWQLAEFAYLDTQYDFNHMVVARPMPAAPIFTEALLRSSTADAILGDRSPKGYTYLALSPTTGGVEVTRETSSVPLNPDTGNQFNLTTARTASIKFELLANGVADIIRGNAGNTATFTVGGIVYEVGQMSMNSALALVTGNKPVKLFMPPDNNGRQEVRLYLGQNVQNQEGNTEEWKKDAFAGVTYVWSPAAFDTLINAQHTEIIYKRS